MFLHVKRCEPHFLFFPGSFSAVDGEEKRGKLMQAGTTRIPVNAYSFHCVGVSQITPENGGLFV